jgi:hypothetical protein
MLAHPFVKGQLMVRPFNGGSSAVVGLVELPREFIPEEGAAYLLNWNAPVSVFPEKINTLPEDYIGGGVNSWLLAPMWQGTKTPGVTMVRFVREFPEQNVWAVVGAQNQPLPSEITGLRAHQDDDLWLSVTNGHVKKIVNPYPDRGQTMEQILRAPVWPHDDKVWGLATLDTESRAVLHRGHQIMLKYGNGETDKETYLRTLKADRAAWNLISGRDDLDFIQYMTRVNQKHPLEPERPKTREELMRLTQASEAAIRAILKEKDEEPKPSRIRFR